MAKVLVVEDDPQLNMTYDILLKKVGHDVSHAYNGLEALGQLGTFKPQVILLDIRMPKMDGIEFLREAQMPTKYPDIKIVLFSNMDQAELVEEAFSLGVHKSVLKSSVAPSQLVAIINELLAA